MVGFNVPDQNNPLGISAAGFVISDEARAEAWATAIDQCLTVDAVQGLAHRLYDRIEMLRGRGASIEIEREAIALCAARVCELTAVAVKACPTLSGNWTSGT